MKSLGLAKPDAKKAGSTPGCLSSQELAEILGKTKRGVTWRADSEGWPYQEVTGRGGPRRLYEFESLPVDVRKAVLIHYGVLPDEIQGCAPEGFDPQKIAKCAQEWDAAQPWQRERAERRLEVLKALWEFRQKWGEGEDGRRARQNPGRTFLCKKALPGPLPKNSQTGHVPAEHAGGGARACMKRFVSLFRDKAIPGVDPSLYPYIRKLSRSTLYEWEEGYRREGIAGLLSRHGATRGETTVPLDQQRFILGVLAQHPNWGKRKLGHSLRAKFNAQAVGDNAIARFIARRKELDPAVFSFLRSPDEYRGRFEPALGNASEKATHFLHWGEGDSTPADVKCTDGRRYTIIGLIDVFSRKTRLQVSRTSNSWGIAALLRRTFSEWGLFENLIRDHGKDYESRMITEALRALDINTPWIPPFSPKSKPHIERFFRTLAHGLEERLPGYIGHNVAERQAIRARNSFADRLMKRGEVIEIGLSPHELQAVIDRWTEDIYHQREHSELGMSPNAKAASVAIRPRKLADTRALDILLAPCGERFVTKKGIQYETGQYWGDELIEYLGRKIQVRVDVRDAGRVFCFDPNNRRFICEAQDLALGGMTVADKIQAQKRATKRIKEKVRALKTMAAEIGDPLADELEAARQCAIVRNLLPGDPVTDNPFVDGAMQAAAAIGAPEEGKEEDRGTRFLQKAGSPDPSGKNSYPLVEQASCLSVGDGPVPHPTKEQLAREKYPEGASIYFDSPDWQMHRSGPQKVLKLRSRDQEQIDRLYFANPREKFEYFRLEQRGRELTAEEVRWLQTYVNEWFDFAEMFCEQWPERDRLWLGRIAPDYFPQYVVEESK